MAAAGPLAQQMGMLLEKCTPEQIAEIFTAVNKMQSEASQPAAAPEAALQRKKRPKRTKASKAARNAGPTFKIVATGAQRGGAPRRPLNSWMAFRCYRESTFKSVPQMKVSGLLARLWEIDPFKAKWSLLAKAYSMIREYKAKEDAPLDVFLSLTCPHIGIIGREEYLATMGWVLSEENGEKKMTRRFQPEITSFPENILTTNLSAEQIVAYCYHVNYVQDGNDNMTDGQTSLTMAAQPQVLELTSVANQAPSGALMYTPRTQAVAESNAVSARIDTALAFNNDNASAASAVRQTVADMNHNGSQYPFNDQFDPLAADVTLFNPHLDNPNDAYAASLVGTYIAPNNHFAPDSFDINDFMFAELLREDMNNPSHHPFATNEYAYGTTVANEQYSFDFFDPPPQ